MSGENNLAFHGFANLVGWLEIDSILHGEMNLLLSGSVCWHLFAPDAVLGMNMNMWDCLGVFRYVSMCSRCSVGLRGESDGSFHAGSSLVGDKPTKFGTTSKGKIVFS